MIKLTIECEDAIVSITRMDLGIGATCSDVVDEMVNLLRGMGYQDKSIYDCLYEVGEQYDETPYEV